LVASGNSIQFTPYYTQYDYSCKFGYYITDGCSKVLVNSTINLIELPPVAVDDTITTTQGAFVSITESFLFANDYLNSSDTISFNALVCPSSAYCKQNPQVTWNSGHATISLTTDNVRCDQNVLQYNIKSASGKISNTANIVIKIVNCICKIPMDFVVVLDG